MLRPRQILCEGVDYNHILPQALLKWPRGADSSGQRSAGIFLCCSANADLFGKKVFEKNHVRLKLLGCTLAQYDWCPYKNGKFRPRDRHEGRTM